MTTRVLIVDDEAPMRALFRAWVEHEGDSTVIEAETVEEGLEKVFVRPAGGCALRHLPPG